MNNRDRRVAQEELMGEDRRSGRERRTEFVGISSSMPWRRRSRQERRAEPRPLVGDRRINPDRRSA